MKQIYRRLLTAYHRFQISSSPQLNLVWGFFFYSLIGWLLLSLPIFHKADISILDNLFTAISAVSTTGLVTAGMSQYNLAGQIIVVGLIQLGGIGYMTLTTYFLLFTTRKMTPWHQKIIGAEFTMPNTIKIKDFIKSAIVFTLIMEVLGAICFYVAFTQSGMTGGQAVWYSIFHSISAFCTAGFGLLGDSFVSYQDNAFMNGIISVLAIAGSLGFIVITDVWYRFTGRSEKISFTTKIIVYGFALLLILGTLMIYLTEPLIQKTSSPVMSSFFQAMTAMTTVGFNTISTGSLTLPMLLFVTFLMYVGASPSGTAGGMKITTLTAMFAIIKSRLTGNKKITFFSRRIPFERLYVATSTFILYTSLIVFFTFLLSFSEEATLDRIIFEVASALGTVGLSAGLTGELSTIGKLLFILIMFIGRVGVLTFGFALMKHKIENQNVVYAEEDIAV